MNDDDVMITITCTLYRNGVQKVMIEAKPEVAPCALGTLVLGMLSCATAQAQTDMFRKVEGTK